MSRFHSCAYTVSKNSTRTCYVLKCDVRKFFASIDHDVLLSILRKYIPDADTFWLLAQIVNSFNSGTEEKGLPLGNLTSQLLVNVYMNEFDQYVKHTLKVKYYIRYADDFVVLSHEKRNLVALLSEMKIFLEDTLKLTLHPNKCYIKTFASGVDFLGWVHFPSHRVLRTGTKRRMLKVMASSDPKPEIFASYLGMLKHGNTYKLQKQIAKATSA